MASAVVGRAFARSKMIQGVSRCSQAQITSFRVSQLSRTPIARSFAGSSRAYVKKYTEDHEWIELSEDGKIGTIGISTYAARALGDVVYVELPTPDTEVSAGEAIGAVESVKSASDIMTPVSGTIVEANSVLEDKPGTINQSPEGDGWLAKIQVAEAQQVESLMDAAAYKQFTEEASED